MFPGNETGNMSVFLAVLNVAGLSLFILNTQVTKTNQKAQEAKIDRVLGDAEQSNLSALSYLQARLERNTLGVAPVSIQNKKIVGASTPQLSVSGGKAQYNALDANKLNSSEMEAAMLGKIPVSSARNSISTQLEILGATQNATQDIYDIRATTMVGLNSSSPVSRSVATIGRVKVAIVLPPPPPPPPAPPPAACSGKLVNGFCFFLGASGNSCAATCTGVKKSYDAAGTSWGGSSDAACSSALAALGRSGPVEYHESDDPTKAKGLGCKYFFGMAGLYQGNWRYNSANATATHLNSSRVCACK